MSGSLNILIADEPVSAGETALLVRRWGHRAEQTHDGFAAVEAARRIKPDLMLVDVGLPLLNGFGVVHQVRQSPGLDRTAFVAIFKPSNGMMPVDLKKGGFRGALSKPVVPLALLDALLKTREALSKSRELSQTSREIAARGRDRSSSARQSIAESAHAIRVSHRSLSRVLPAGAPESSLPSLRALLEELIAANRLTPEQQAVVAKIVAGDAESLLPEEARIHAVLRQRFLEPACKLCRYRIPREEVVDAWTNGGYCKTCAEIMR